MPNSQSRRRSPAAQFAVTVAASSVVIMLLSTAFSFWIERRAAPVPGWVDRTASLLLPGTVWLQVGGGIHGDHPIFAIVAAILTDGLAWALVATLLFRLCRVVARR